MFELISIFILVIWLILISSRNAFLSEKIYELECSLKYSKNEKVIANKYKDLYKEKSDSLDIKLHWILGELKEQGFIMEEKKYPKYKLVKVKK